MTGWVHFQCGSMAGVNDPAAPAVLITIPLSHYCEKARWGLDHVGLAYREETHAPLFHLRATKGNGGSSVPLLVQGPNRCTDSTDILKHADAVRGGDILYPRDAQRRREVEELEEHFDSELGTQVRRWVYGSLLDDTALMRSLWSSRTPPFEGRMISVLTPVVRALVRQAYKVTPAGAQRSLERVRAVFSTVDSRLSDGRRYLSGERFTAADLTFASLAAPALFPAQCRAVMPTLEAVPAPMRAEIERFRETVAGQFALRLYAQERA
jgi:glutathione S-transferase